METFQYTSIPAPTLLITTIIFLYFVHKAQSYYRLSHVPGPLSHSVSSLGLLRSHLRGSPHLEISSLTRKYGPLIRVGPKSVITSDVKTIQRISGVKSPYTKGDWYRPFRFIKGKDHSFSMVDEPSHSTLRHKVASGYRGSTAMEEAVDRQVIRLVDLIERKFVSEDTSNYKPMDFTVITHLFALDIIGDVTFGNAFGFLDEGVDFYGFLKWNEDFFSITATSAVLPTLVRLAHVWPFSEMLPKSTDHAGLGRFIRHSEEVIGKRYNQGADDGKDLVSTFMKMGVTKDEAVNQSLISVVAGTDSVASTIRMTILYLTSNPRAYNMLLTELDKAKVEGRISSPIQNTEAKQLPYLQAVIREGMRVYPGGTGLFFKQVPAGGDEVAGYKLPGGTEVGADVWGALRNQEFWGPDADMFRPERWLNLPPAQLSAMIECLDFQFGYGRYQCLGRPLVFLEMNKALPELLRRFEFAAVNPVTPTKIRSAGFHLMNEFNVIVTARAA